MILENMNVEKEEFDTRNFYISSNLSTIKIFVIVAR